MSVDNPRQTTECPPPPKKPADQPNPPGDGTACTPVDETKPPTLPEPTPCPETDCKCPPKPSSNPNCLEDLIAKQAADIATAEKAADFKKLLETFLGKAKLASGKYTRDKYDALVKKWVEADRDLAEVVRKMACAVPCWRCVIECYVCPLINDMHMAEARLYGSRKLYTDVDNLYDLQYWHTRDKSVKDQRLDRIGKVLTAWDDPATTIEKALAENATAMVEAAKGLAIEPGKVVFDLLLKIVPKHLAIAPPTGSAWTTRIGAEYTNLCPCDPSPDPDNCCGPDVGKAGWSLAQRLVGPLPYLVDPNDYFTLICCLVKQRYAPAQEAANKARNDLAAVDAQIARYAQQVANGLTNFNKDARAAIPSIVDCCTFEREQTEPTSQAR